MKYFVIVNPTCGRGLGGRSIAEIRSRFDQQNCEYDLVETARRGHALELAENAAKADYDVLVCASGDGTINEAINGIVKTNGLGNPKLAFGVITVGTGNDFAGGVGIPTGLNPSMDILFKNETKMIDLGLVKGGDFPEGRYFGNGIGIGFDAAVGRYAEKIRWTRGLLAYLIGVIQTVFFYYTPPKLKLNIDGREIIQKCLMVSIMNGTRMGGGFKMAPQSSIDDGLFDLCIVETASKARILGVIPHFLKGTQAGEKEVKMTRGKQISVDALEGDFPCHADGEMITFNGSHLDVDLFPSSFKVIV